MNIFQIATIVTIMGICALYIIGEHKGFAPLDLASPDESAGADIHFIGVVTRATQTSQSTHLLICNSSTISVILFDPVNITTGRQVEVFGELKDSDNSLSIIANQVNIIS